MKRFGAMLLPVLVVAADASLVGSAVRTVLRHGLYGPHSGPYALADDAKKKDDYKGKPAARLVHYTGTVQGVGFRATAVDIAKDFPVTGYVKNLPDGRVQLLAEGPEDGVEAFLKAIRAKWKDNIKDAKVEEQKVSGKYEKFTIER